MFKVGRSMFDLRFPGDITEVAALADASFHFHVDEAL